MSESIPAGWYPDPVDGTVQRYWDGEQWVGSALPVDATPPDRPEPADTEPAGTGPAGAGPGNTRQADSEPAGTGRSAGRSSAAPSADSAPQPPHRSSIWTLQKPPGGVPAPTAGRSPKPSPPVPVSVDEANGATLVHGRRLAPLSARFMARLVDVLVVTGLNIVVNGWFVYEWWQEMLPTYADTTKWFAGQLEEQPVPTERASGLLYAITLIGLALWLAYEVPALTSNGQTLGKQLFHIKVLQYDGKHPNVATSLRRWSFMAVPNLVAPCLVPLQLADVLWCTWDRPLQQCLHDKTSRTVVVQLGPADRTPAPSDSDGPSSA